MPYYKNQYLDEPLEVQVTLIEEDSKGNILSKRIRLKNGNEMKLLPYEFKYLSETKPIATLYDVCSHIETEIYEIIDWSPNQITDLFSFINDKKTNDVINITFTEEVKDGRTPKFDIYTPMKLKNKILVSGDFAIKIVDVTFIKTLSDTNRYSEYHRYLYKVIISLIK